MNAIETRQASWAARSPRERLILLLAITLAVLAILWWIALAPALHTLSDAAQEHSRLDAQLEQMTALQAQAKLLQTQPRADREEALRALRDSVRERFGEGARVQDMGDAVHIAVDSLQAEVLAQWLAQTRANARSVPREVHLTRVQAPPPAASEAHAGPPTRWEGRLVMSLPGAR